MSPWGRRSINKSPRLGATLLMRSVRTLRISFFSFFFLLHIYNIIRRNGGGTDLAGKYTRVYALCRRLYIYICICNPRRIESLSLSATTSRRSNARNIKRAFAGGEEYWWWPTGRDFRIVKTETIEKRTPQRLRVLPHFYHAVKTPGKVGGGRGPPFPFPPERTHSLVRQKAFRIYLCF